MMHLLTSDDIQNNRPQLFELFRQWSTPVPTGTVSFKFMPTKQLLDDLDNLDAALALMIPSMELRDVYVDGVQFDTVTYPALLISDLAKLKDNYEAQGLDNAAKKGMLQEFLVSQIPKQAYLGTMVLLPFAGQYTHSKTPLRVGVDVDPGKTIHTVRPMAMKQTDLDLTLPWLMRKCHTFTEHRLELLKFSKNWKVSSLVAEGQQMECLFDVKLAGKKCTVQNSVTCGGENRYCGPLRYMTEDEYDKEHSARALQLHETTQKFDQIILWQERTNKEILRTTMRTLDKCSTQMQIALRVGTGDANLPISVSKVRHMWDCELSMRALQVGVHPADISA